MKEILTYSDFHQGIHRQSSIIPSLTVEEDGPGVMYCPRCELEQKGIDHGKTVRCVCGLNMQRFGNALYIWEGEESQGGVGYQE
jgi:hypothetical protein